MLVKDKVSEIFRSSFDLDITINLDDIEYESIKQWDSIAHMALVAELENTFNIMIETDDIIDMSSYKKTIQIVEKYLSNQAS